MRAKIVSATTAQLTKSMRASDYVDPPPPIPMKGREVWSNNSVQFPRLLAEIRAGGLTSSQRISICASMDIRDSDLNELLKRAEKVFEEKKKDIALQKCRRRR